MTDKIDLISRAAALTAFIDFGSDIAPNCEKCHGSELGFSMSEVRNILNGVPLEVVRCRECKHYYRSRIGKGIGADYFCTHPKGLKARLQEDDFCSYGELKKGSKNNAD